ncbi:hypothetical protein BD324DRAFT_648241 [Kockovaella imperatae]|uniref:Uncharacterized protein n=1 Tax=Kockovaella imperatae TaxID=4999 RepID=A0A1Y1UNF9_9TREE|nr:hypothetical protein BD324DRAFT_648241 [Kockovaella imperatae]ORX39600.1 hypothetical protein BD324DRAFT_648241 [Kockovaella imperatae]
MPIRPTFNITSKVPNKIASLAGPHRLAKLLSLLPHNGVQSVIQPALGNHDTFYLVTRTKLKYRAVELRDPNAEKPKGQDGIPLAKGDNKFWRPVDPMESGPEAGEMKASGPVWVMRFKDGRYVSPRYKSAMPDQQMKFVAQDPWLAVDKTAIPSETREAIAKWKESYDRQVEIREKVMLKQKKAREQFLKDQEAKKKEKRKNLESWRRQARKVSILY